MQWIGFSTSDLVEFVIAVAFLALTWRRWIQPFVLELALRPGLSMAVLLILPIALRLALLPEYAIPTPKTSDDFSYLLMADTLRHFRLANPVHPLHEFFETTFALQEPSYASIFPLGQGIVLAIGWSLFGHPWAGVALSIGAMCALTYWMLGAWTSPEWALVGGLLAVIEFGPLNQWMNSFWGGAVSACAGCLVFGTLPRFRASMRARYGALLGFAIGLQWLCRPYETIFLIVSAGLFLLPAWRSLARPALWCIFAVLPAVGLSLLQNRQVTGHWTTLPYQLSRFEYGIPTTFTFQPLPLPHRPLTREQQRDYDQQSDVHGPETDDFGSYWERWASRLEFYRFFFLAPLYLVIPAFLLRVREWRFACVLLTILLFSLGTNFYPYFYSHYVAATTCLFVLISVIGLERLGQWNRLAASIVLVVCAAHFLFWYGLRLVRDTATVSAMSEFETSDAINHGDPQGRIAIRRQLDATPGQQLVFVRYGPQHGFEEWVHNAADIDGSRIVWARDLGADENRKLLSYYPNRMAWLLQPDLHPPKLQPYPR